MKSKQVFLLLLVFGITAQAVAYPISPRPLRKLIMESGYIITGFVLDIQEQPRKKKDDWWGGSIAIVRVKQVLQGTLKDTVVRISFEPNMICPAPPYFEKHTYVVAFLDRDGNDKVFRVHALSYGIKTVAVEVADLYANRIAEMQAILKLDDSDTQFKQTVDWLVTCAEHPATRYEGIYELIPGSDFMSYYDRAQAEPFQYMLTSEQKLRLKNALLRHSGNQYENFGLVDLIYAGNEAEVFNYLIQGLEHIDKNQYWYADEFMKRLALYKSSPRLQQLLEQYSDIKFKEDDLGKIQNFIDSFLQEIRSL